MLAKRTHDAHRRVDRSACRCGWRRAQAKAKASVPDNVDALDSDVAAEFRRVAEGQYSERAPVQVANLVKEFGGGKVAVNNVSLVIEDRMTFGYGADALPVPPCGRCNDCNSPLLMATPAHPHPFVARLCSDCWAPMVLARRL